MIFELFMTVLAGLILLSPFIMILVEELQRLKKIEL